MKQADLFDSETEAEAEKRGSRRGLTVVRQEACCHDRTNTGRCERVWRDRQTRSLRRRNEVCGNCRAKECRIVDRAQILASLRIGIGTSRSQCETGSGPEIHVGFNPTNTRIRTIVNFSEAVRAQERELE